MSYKVSGVRVLGVDVGLASCGWGIAGRVAGRSSFYRVESGVIKTSAGEPEAERLLSIYEQISAVLRRHNDIDAVCIEAVYFGRNVSSAMSTAAVIGVVSLAGAQAGVPVLKKTPAQIKKITGAGRAGKDAVSLVVHRLLSLSPGEIKADHETDALAAAVAGVLELGAVAWMT